MSAIHLMNEASEWLEAGDKTAPLSRGARLILLSNGTRGFGRMLELWWMVRSREQMKLIQEIQAAAIRKAKR